ncbi:hypothetical protein K523DRAFT_106043 [Schizophyllum commune Tattone D]|nr:hypothetical protein K523DRAFT_106043 [Schizophyllum commune Tattone D]
MLSALAMDYPLCHGPSPHATFATLPRSRALMYSHIVHISSLSVSLTVALWRYLSGWLIGLVVRSFLVTFRYNYQLVGASLAGLGCRRTLCRRFRRSVVGDDPWVNDEP